MHHKKPNFLFKSGPLSVTQHMLRFRGRRYKLVHLENTILKRPLFYMALTWAGLLIGSIVFNADVLFAHEILVMLILAASLAAATWPFGTIHMQSRTLSVSGGSITWFYKDLAKAQDIMERIFDDREITDEPDLQST